MAALYDTIGLRYGELRRTEPAIASAIAAALGGATPVLNVGAGAGSYEPKDRRVIAVEPSTIMLRQRPKEAAPAVQADAMRLPFADDTFAGAMAVLTVHHWADQDRGLRELRRVTRGPIVILTWDPDTPAFWLGEYIPDIFTVDAHLFPKLQEYGEVLGRTEIEPVPVPHDCRDGFLCAYWRRPEAYLDERVRNSVSTFSKLGDIAAGLERLRQDLASGDWDRRYGHLRAETELDLGYRLVIAKECT